MDDTTPTPAWLASADDEEIWDRFLADHAAVVLQVVHFCERDEDQRADCFVFVCEQLRKNNLRRLRKFDAVGGASFTTWLRAVVRNLHIDWRRHRYGRPRAFRSIKRLSTLDQAVFRCVHQRGLSGAEALHELRPEHPALTERELAASLERVAAELSPRQRWLLSQRGATEESLSGVSGDGREVERQLPDPKPSPEAGASFEEQRAALSRAMKKLDPQDRLLLRFHYEQGIGFERIGRLTGLGNGLKISRRIARILARLRQEIDG